MTSFMGRHHNMWRRRKILRGARTSEGNQEVSNMTLRDATALVIGVGSFLALGACATAGPVFEPRRLLVSQAAGYEVEVIVDGAPAPTFSHGGGTFVMGQLGERYTLRIVNHTGQRAEAVVSVDGRDVVDGRPADFRSKRGYLVPAWGQIDIDGWRLSNAQVAAFRFSSVAESYAARTGSAREVGVIGAAIFPERYLPPPPYRPLELPPSPPPPPYGHYRDDAGAAPAPGKSGGGLAEEGESAPPASRSAPAPMPERQRPGLGTEFGESMSSPVQEVPFVRANPTRPAVVLGVRYNDHDGLIAMGIDVDRDSCVTGWCDRDTMLRQTANPFPVVERRYAAPPPCWRENGDGYGCAR
jgi:hypothetical protein